jgi:alkylhydroperoxidase family enzyme
VGTPVGNRERDEQLTPLDELREVVASTPAAPDVMAPYLEKVHAVAYKITDAEVDALKAAGVSEDEIFEQTVAAAISEGLRRLDAAIRVITRRRLDGAEQRAEVPALPAPERE